jgi:hypothetical protein
MSDEPLNFEEHRRRRQADAELVPCAKCKTRIPALSTRCPECGVHFSGVAEDFVQEGVGGRGTPTWVVVVAVLLLMVVLTSLFGRW